MIICIEGIDGCGKTTVANALAKEFGCEVISFPNDSAYTGPLIRAYLRKEWHTSFYGAEMQNDAPELMQYASALTFQALQIANRMELMPKIQAAAFNGDNLILCRYWQSAWVYGQLDGLSREWLEQTHATIVQPDINVLLDAPLLEDPVGICLKRLDRKSVV